MARVHIVTEGATEKNFVDDILKPYMSLRGIYIDAHSITTRKDRRKNLLYRGGLNNIDHLFRDLKLWLKESASQDDCWVTTMVDLYAFPYTDRPDWLEGYAQQNDGLNRALFLEAQIAKEFNMFPKFIPYIQLHEYESLLLVNTTAIHAAFSDQYNANTLNQLNQDIGNLDPEEVNHGQHTAPSKRIIRYYPEYNDSKPVWGSLIAQEIGIESMRERCPHFNDWVCKLEEL